MIKICAIIPVFNNENTIYNVVLQSKEFVDKVIVINDGSTDNTLSVISSIDGIFVDSFDKNIGKGAALRRGFEAAREFSFTHAITLDADGQHFPQWLVIAKENCEKEPEKLLIGARNGESLGEIAPVKNINARKFGNFWIKLYTGYKLSDTQSGFRVYPVEKTAKIRFTSNRFEFEQEVLVKSAWAGIELGEFSIPQFYQNTEERVSHYRVFRDSVRISLFFAMTAFGKAGKIFADELKSNITPLKAAISFSLGVFFGLFPIYGFQAPTVILLAIVAKLNRPLAVLGTMISAPPLIPFIILAALKIGGFIFPDEQIVSSIELLPQNIVGTGKHFIVGSIILAVAAGILSFVISYPVCRIIKYSRKR